MNAIVVEKYGGIENLVHKRVPKPTELNEYDVLVRLVLRPSIAIYPRNTEADLYSVKAASVNPIDMKVRAGVYDDYAGE